jgi:uncharacterized damage-inducible protein DinB
MPFSQTLLPEFDEEMKNTRKMLECIPDNKLDYQPHPKSMNLIRLATHVAELPSWTVLTIDQDVLDMPADYQPHFAKSRAELLEMFDKGVAEARPKIHAATDQHWHQIWTFKFAGKTIMAMPRAAVMRSVIMNHLIHHRAQLSVYLRLNDVKIPGMYGPSADETNIFAAQSAQKL